MYRNDTLINIGETLVDSPINESNQYIESNQNLKMAARLLQMMITLFDGRFLEWGGRYEMIKYFINDIIDGTKNRFKQKNVN